MIGAAGVRIWLATAAVDGLGFDTLCGIVPTARGTIPVRGHVRLPQPLGREGKVSSQSSTAWFFTRRGWKRAPSASRRLEVSIACGSAQRSGTVGRARGEIDGIKFIAIFRWTAYDAAESWMMRPSWNFPTTRSSLTHLIVERDKPLLSEANPIQILTQDNQLLRHRLAAALLRSSYGPRAEQLIPATAVVRPAGAGLNFRQSHHRRGPSHPTDPSTAVKNCPNICRVCPSITT